MSMFTIAGAPTIEEGDMELIYSVTLTTTTETATINTGTLATGFKSLLLKARLRSDLGFTYNSPVNIYFNGDFSESNYQEMLVQSHNNGGSPSTSTTNAPGMLFAPTTGGDADFYSGGTVEIYNHESTTGFKSATLTDGIHCFSATPHAGNFRRFFRQQAIVWRNTAAITSIQLKSEAFPWDVQSRVGDLIAGTSIEVYGLK